VDQKTALSGGLISTDNNSVKFGVEHANVVQNGRQSIRIESKNTYNQGLIIADIAHMPGSICGTWPAFWTIGPDWPTKYDYPLCQL
jgi:beta-glucanase (GH16 family)